MTAKAIKSVKSFTLERHSRMVKTTKSKRVKIYLRRCFQTSIALTRKPHLTPEKNARVNWLSRSEHTTTIEGFSSEKIHHKYFLWMICTRKLSLKLFPVARSVECPLIDNCLVQMFS